MKPTILAVLLLASVFVVACGEGAIDSADDETAAVDDAVTGAGPLNVLLYAGSDAASNDVNGTASALQQASANNWIAGTTFKVTTTTKINASTLAGMDVVIMPGGDGGHAYLTNPNIDGSALRSFVSGGKGYYGTCAGAYAAVKHVNGYYDGWGLAPHVTADSVEFIGTLSEAITSAGQTILGLSGPVTLRHYRGPAMTASAPATVLATFADNNTGHKGAAAIISDTLGSGRTILCASHPEVSPSQPKMVARMAAWAAGRLTGSNPSTSSSLTLSAIAAAGKSVAAFAQANSRLPNYVTLGSKQVDMPSFLMLEVSAVVEMSAGKTDAIALKTFSAALSPADTSAKGQMPVSEYVSVASRVQAYMSSNGRAPNYASQTSLGSELGFANLVYLYAKAVDFYGTNSRLANYVTLDLDLQPGASSGTSVSSGGWNAAGAYNFDYEDSDYNGWGEVTCGPTSLEMLFSELAGGVTKMGQDSIARIAGTGSGGTAPDSLVAAAVTVGNDIGIPVTASKSSFAAVGWAKTAELVKDPSKGIIFHIMTGGLPGWQGDYGHYVFPVGVNLGTSTVRIADPIKGVHEYSFADYEGAMNSISTPNQVIIVQKK